MREEIARLQRERDVHLGKETRPPKPPLPELLPERHFSFARDQRGASLARLELAISQKTEEVDGTGGIVWDAGEALARWLHTTHSGGEVPAAVEVCPLPAARCTIPTLTSPLPV